MRLFGFSQRFSGKTEMRKPVLQECFVRMPVVGRIAVWSAGYGVRRNKLLQPFPQGSLSR